MLFKMVSGKSPAQSELIYLAPAHPKIGVHQGHGRHHSEQLPGIDQPGHTHVNMSFGSKPPVFFAFIHG